MDKHGRQNRARLLEAVEDIRTDVLIVLPLPDQRLGPNGRCFWRQKAALTKEHYTLALYETRVQTHSFEPWWEAASMEYRAFFKSRRFPDDDNFMGCCKAYRDGICAAGLVRDDRGVRLLPVVFGVDRERPRLEVVIRGEDAVRGLE